MSNNIEDILNFSDESVIETDVIDYLSNPNIKPVESTGIKSNTVSFKEPITNKPYINNAKPATGKKFILKSIFIDSKTQKRTRVELTPSICDLCAFDIAEKNGFGSWGRVPTDVRPALIEALQEHKQKTHFASDALIIDEAQMPDRWLGSSF